MTNKNPDIQLSGLPDWLQDPALGAVLEALDATDGNARIVGGAVRNALMGFPVADVDIATIWSPDQIIDRLETAGIRAVETGRAHGTITAVLEGKSYEITTLRVDVSGDGRHAKVAFTDNWAADAARRDFTINALYIEANGSLFDPLGGLQDIRDRRICFIGCADERIREDYLRVLRFFRFHAQFATGDIDPEGLAACVRGRAGVGGLSAERVRAELLRLLAIDDSVGTIEIMAQTGILISLLGGVAYTSTLGRLAEIQRVNGYPADPLLRLIVLGCKIREDALRLAGRLRLSTSESKRMIRGLDQYSLFSPTLDDAARKALVYRLGTEVYSDSVLLAWANSGGDTQSQSWIELLGLPEIWSPPAFPITAEMVMKRDVKPGKILGNILRHAEKVWIEAGFPANSPEIETILEQAILAETP